MAKQTYPRTISKKKIAGTKNPVGTFITGIGTIKNVLAGVGDTVARAAHPRRRS